MVATSDASSNVEAEGHVCGCGMRCKPGKCCCEPHRPENSSSPDDAKGPSGPCFDASPCGDPASPAPGLPSIKLAVLSVQDRAFDSLLVQKTSTAEEVEAISPCPDRLEDPPDLD